jgi:hypothetical protein
MWSNSSSHLFGPEPDVYPELSLATASIPSLTTTLYYLTVSHVSLMIIEMCEPIPSLQLLSVHCHFLKLVFLQHDIGGGLRPAWIQMAKVNDVRREPTGVGGSTQWLTPFNAIQRPSTPFNARLASELLAVESHGSL